MNSRADEPSGSGQRGPATPEEDAAAAAAGGHPAQPRTGSDQPWEPEDLAVAQGHDPTPKNVARARRQLDEEGAAAIEKTVP